VQLPIRTPLFDADGNLTRPWIVYLQSLNRTAENAVVGAPKNPTSVSAAEVVSERYKDQNALVYTPIVVTVTLPENSGAEWITVWATNYAGDGWDWIGKWWVGDTIRFHRIVPAAGASWKVKCVTGHSRAENPPETAVQSAPFSIAPIANAVAAGITNASLGPLTYSQSSDGSVTWGLEYVRWTLPSPAQDPNAWSSVLTVQKVDAAGNPAPDYEGAERPVVEDARMGQTVEYPIAYWTIPPADSQYRTFRFRLYLFSRNETRVLQTTCWSGADHADVVPAAQGPVLPALPSSVSASEDVSGRTKDDNALVYTPITVNVTLPAGHNALWVIVWATNYAGDGWDWIGKWYVGETVKFTRIVPAAGASWKVKVATGNYVGEHSPEQAVQSASFAIAPISNASAYGITSASLGTVGYGTGYQGTGTTKWWGIDHVRYTLPSAAADPTFWHSILTVQKVDVSGTPASDQEGVERPVIEHTGAGASIDFPILYWTIPVPGSAFRYFRFRLYSVSRNGNRVLQTTCWSGASYAQVEVPQPPDKGYLDLSAVDPATVGNGLVVSAGKLAVNAGSSIDFSAGQVVVKLGSIQSTHLAAGSLGDLSKYASDKRPVVVTYGLPVLPSSDYPNGALIFNTADGKLYRNNGGTWTKGTDPQDLIAGTIAAGVVYAGSVTVSQLTAGNAVFSGDASFARSGGGKVTINSSGLVLVDNATSPTATLQISSSGISIAQGSSSVTITASSVAIVNGNLTSTKITAASSSGYGTVVIDPNALEYPLTVTNSSYGHEVAIGASAAVGAEVMVRSTNSSNRYPLARMSRGASGVYLNLNSSPFMGYPTVDVYVSPSGASVSYFSLVQVPFKVGGVVAISENRVADFASVNISGTEVISSDRQLKGSHIIALQTSGPTLATGQVSFYWDGSAMWLYYYTGANTWRKQMDLV